VSEQAPQSGTTRHTLESVLAAVEVGCTLLGTSRALGVSRTTIRRYRKRWASVDEALEAKRGELVDEAESQLRAAVLRGESWAIVLVLKTLGKNYGYSERTELAGVNAKPITFVEVVPVRYVNDWRGDGDGRADDGAA